MSERPRSKSDLADSLSDAGCNKTGNTSESVSGTDDGAKGEPTQLTLNIDTSLSLKDLNKLGHSHFDRFRQFEEPDDIDKAIEYFSRVLDLTPGDHPKLPDRLTNLGASYGSRFQRRGTLEDLEKSIAYYSHALPLVPQDHPTFLLHLKNLGVSYTDRYRRLGELSDLEKVIRYDSRALELTPNGHPDLSCRHANLGTSYRNRFRHLGDLGDLETAIRHEVRALQLTPNGHPDLPSWHAALGASYGDRFERLGNLQDLETAIKNESCALMLTPDGHPDLSSRHANLGASCRDRFKRLGDLQDLETAIKHEYRALELTPDNHPDLPSRHANLGASYRGRFKRMGDLQDAEVAIKHASCALKLTPDDHPDLPSRHANLGASCRDRFKRLGNLQDLEIAIKHESRALELTPDDHSALPYWHANLGASYRDRFELLGVLQDLETAIKHDSCALKLTPVDHPALPYRYTNLGLSYRDRFERLGDLQDLETAIKHEARAVELTPEDHPELSRKLNNLATYYINRFDRLHKQEDLERGIKLASRALASTPDGHPDLLDKHYSQALIFLLQHQHTGNPSHLTSALDSFRKASQSVSGSPRVKFWNALDWATRALYNRPLNCIEAYQTTIDLLPEFVWLGATTSQRYKDLSAISNLAINAAYAAIHHSGHALALEWLEHARCVVWNQSLMLRSPLDQLRVLHSDLATRLQAVADQLNDATSNGPASQAFVDDSANLEETSQQRRRLAKEYNDLLVEIRGLPGFEDFLQPMKAKRLVCAAQYGPVVVINCHADRCDALLILPDQDGIKHISLSNFTEKDARDAQSRIETSLRNKQLRERGVRAKVEPRDEDRIGSVLTILWHNIVKPVLDFLGYTNKVTTGDLPHITWCPTGALSSLPFHAAGDFEQARARVFDYAVSSYAPTLTALLASTSSLLERSPRVLAIGQEYTPGHNPLPGTAKELDFLQNHTQNRAEYLELTGNQATTKAVLEAMDGHDWVHFACHAHQNVDDPTKSGFYLHGGTLDLAAINRRSFRNKGLAFLSACQTAMGDEKLPDEAIHLASGMLMAGYPSVIATMWSVVDDDAPVVADKVYAELMKEGKIGNGEAGRALHSAVAALRKKVGEKNFARWVPYIHIGS